MLEVRILPGEPKFFSIKHLQNLGRAFGSRPNPWDVKCKSVVRKLLKGKSFTGSCPRVSKRCHKNVVPRLDFRAAGSLLVPAERTFWLRDLIDHSVESRTVTAQIVALCCCSDVSVARMSRVLGRIVRREERLSREHRFGSAIAYDSHGKRFPCAFVATVRPILALYGTLLLWLKYKYCRVLITNCLRRDIKAIGLGYEERSA